MRAKDNDCERNVAKKVKGKSANSGACWFGICVDLPLAIAALKNFKEL